MLIPCHCPALGETVYFTSVGLNHLLYKKRRPRNHNERHYRMSLIEFLIPVITEANTAVKTIMTTFPKEVITWTLQLEIITAHKKRVIKIILIKEGAGKVNFLSVMEKNKKHPGNS